LLDSAVAEISRGPKNVGILSPCTPILSVSDHGRFAIIHPRNQSTNDHLATSCDAICSYAPQRAGSKSSDCISPKAHTRQTALWQACTTSTLIEVEPIQCSGDKYKPIKTYTLADKTCYSSGLIALIIIIITNRQSKRVLCT